MERFTISLDEKLASEFDQLIKKRGYLNRSEAVRDMLRDKLDALRLQDKQALYCIANLSYVYNHHERDLAERLTELQHHHHDLVVASTHVHLDHENCLETVMLRGKTDVVRRFADTMIAERGVRHGQINLVPVDVEAGHGHVHSHPKT
ncbi:MAG: nickel-responsive transcriptional regulator NikR [Gallionellaceae bacterium]|nr:nickel-responsive transcriptional regulator NikR [Gallionellaceae bacterium]